MGANRPRAATVQDCDEGDQPVRGTTRRASTKTDTRDSKSSKGARESRSSKKEKSRSDSGYSSQAIPTASDTSSPPTQRVELARKESTKSTPDDRDKERGRKTSSASIRSPRKSTSKPPSAHTNISYPKIDTNVAPTYTTSKTDPSYYPYSATPVITQTAPPVRPPSAPIGYQGHRQPRPTSYYGMLSSPHDQRPPLSRSAWANSPSPLQPVSFPAAVGYGYPTPPVESYFSQTPLVYRGLADRFQSNESIQRPASAAGVRRLTEDFYNMNGYESASEGPNRRNSLRMRQEDEATLMTPPQNPPYRRPNMSNRAATEGMPGAFPLDDYENPPPRYEKVRVPREEREERSRSKYREVLPAPPRRPSVPRFSTYDAPRSSSKIRVEPSGRQRPRSYYQDSAANSNDYEEKLRGASSYLDETSGGPARDLTAAALRQQARATGSSRSTRSTRSREDSEFKQSVTTRTTGTGLGDEDLTIKLKGAGSITIAGAEINFNDDTEINIPRRKSIRGGSDMSGSIYGVGSGALVDDRRIENGERRAGKSRPKSYSRAPSRSGRERGAPTVVQHEYDPYNFF